MAKKQSSGGAFAKKSKIRRPGVHSKNNKPCKKYRGQGRRK